MPPWFSGQHGSNLEQTLNIFQHTEPPRYFTLKSLFLKNKHGPSGRCSFPLSLFTWTGPQPFWEKDPNHHPTVVYLRLRLRYYS